MGKKSSRKRVIKNNKTVKPSVRKVIEDRLGRNGGNNVPMNARTAMMNRLQNIGGGGIVPQNMNMNPQYTALHDRALDADKRTQNLVQQMETMKQEADKKKKVEIETINERKKLKKELKTSHEEAIKAEKNREEIEEIEKEIERNKLKITQGNTDFELLEAKKLRHQHEMEKINIEDQTIILKGQIEKNKLFEEAERTRIENEIKRRAIEEQEKIVKNPKFSKADEYLSEQMKEKLMLEEKKRVLEKFESLKRENAAMEDDMKIRSSQDIQQCLKNLCLMQNEEESIQISLIDIRFFGINFTSFANQILNNVQMPIICSKMKRGPITK